MLESIHATDWIFLVAMLVLLMLSGIFSATEIGMLSINRFRLHQLAEEGSPRARLLQRLLLHPSRLLTVILILITSLNYINESLVTYWLSEVRGFPEWVPFVALLILVLIFAEVTPINYAAANPEVVSTRLAPVVAAMMVLLRPVVFLITGIANGVLRLFGGEARTTPLVTGEDVLAIVDIETERGVLEEEEKELIHSIFEFSDTIVREIMVPRIDIIAIEEDAPIGDAIAIIIEHRFSRLPVYQGNLDHMIGLVHTKDLLPYQYRHETAFPVRQAMRPAIFVPESKRVSELLQELRETKQTLAIVLDEYGGTAGLVTTEDLLEEIVGEIYDEYDVEERAIEWLEPGTLVVDAKLSIDEVGDLLHHELPEGEYDTIGGLLYNRFGDVPTRGEYIVLDDFQLFVERLDGHRITKVRILLPPEDHTAQ